MTLVSVSCVFLCKSGLRHVSQLTHSSNTHCWDFPMSPDSQTRIKCPVNHTSESALRKVIQSEIHRRFPPRNICQLRFSPPILPPGHRKWVPQWARHWRLILQETGSALTCLREDDISSAFIISFPFTFQLMNGKEALLKGGAFVYMRMISGVSGMCYHTRISSRRVHTWLCDIWITADQCRWRHAAWMFSEFDPSCLLLNTWLQLNWWTNILPVTLIIPSFNVILVLIMFSKR